MKIPERLELPACFVAILLIVFPLLDTWLAVLPMNLTDLRWRYGAAGLFSEAVMTPLLGVLILLGVAVGRARRRLLYVLLWGSAILAAILLLVVTVVALDAWELRVQVQPEQQTSFLVASLVAVGKLGLGILGFALVVGAARGALRDGEKSTSTGSGKARKAGVVMPPPPRS